MTLHNILNIGPENNRNQGQILRKRPVFEPLNLNLCEVHRRMIE